LDEEAYGLYIDIYHKNIKDWNNSIM
jgi:hypothetical protein